MARENARHANDENADGGLTTVRRRVVYRGRVQGVGFRYTCAQIAANFAVSGWVRNMSDGGVELEAQGAADEVERFLAEIAREMAGNIQSAQVVEIATVVGERGFQIRA